MGFFKDLVLIGGTFYLSASKNVPGVVLWHWGQLTQTIRIRIINSSIPSTHGAACKLLGGNDSRPMLTSEACLEIGRLLAGTGCGWATDRPESLGVEAAELLLRDALWNDVIYQRRRHCRFLGTELLHSYVTLKGSQDTARIIEAVSVF